MGVLSLGLQHLVPHSLVPAQHTGHIDLGFDFVAVEGHKTGAEKFSICSFASRYGIGVDDGDVLDGGFCAGKSSGLGEQHIAGIHQQGDLLGVAYHVDAPVTGGNVRELILEFIIEPAHNHRLHRVIERLQNLLDSLLDLAIAHTSGHHQKPRLVSVQKAEFLLADAPGLVPCHFRRIELPAYRYSPRQYLLP